MANICLLIFGKCEIIFPKEMKHNEVDKGFKTSVAWNALIAQAGKIGIRRRGPQVDEYGRYIERAVTNDSIDGGVEGRLSTRRSSRRYLFYIRVSKRYLKKFVSFRITMRTRRPQTSFTIFSVSWMRQKKFSFFFFWFSNEDFSYALASLVPSFYLSFFSPSAHGVRKITAFCHAF